MSSRGRDQSSSSDNFRQLAGADDVEVRQLEGDDQIEWRPRHDFLGFNYRGRPAGLATLAVGGVCAVVSPFLPQVRSEVIAGDALTVNGWGSFHRVGTSSNGAFYGHGPALGAVAFGAGIVIVVFVAVSATRARRGLTAMVPPLCSGIVVGTLACQVMEGYEYTRWSWASGLWLLAASAVALVAGSAILGLDGPSAGRAR